MCPALGCLPPPQPHGGHPALVLLVAGPATSCRVTAQLLEAPAELARLHGHGIHAAMGHLPFLECSQLKQESLHLEVAGFAQDQQLQHREVPALPAGWGGRGAGSGKGNTPTSAPALLSPNPLGLGQFCLGSTSPAMRVLAALRMLSLCIFWGLLGVGTSLPTAES